LGFINQALFPSQRVTLVAIDGRMEPCMKSKLAGLGMELMEVPPCRGVMPSVSGHPDMQMIHIRDNLLVCRPGMPEYFVDKLRNRGFEVYLGSTVLKKKYPGDIAYNVAIIGKTAFHNIRYTDPVLADILEKCAIRLVNVKQGYSKCSILAVTPESLITADSGIAAAAETVGIDVLRIPPQKKILLSGMNYGFIGGTAGYISNDTLAFTGNLDKADSSIEIKAFLKKYGIRHVSLGETAIYDNGGLLPLCQASLEAFP